MPTLIIIVVATGFTSNRTVVIGGSKSMQFDRSMQFAKPPTESGFRSTIQTEPISFRSGSKTNVGSSPGARSSEYELQHLNSDEGLKFNSELIHESA